VIAQVGLAPGLFKEEAQALRELERSLLGLWAGAGFGEVVPPLLLPEGPSRAASSEALLPRTLTVPGEGQAPLALRSDFTAGVAWMVAQGTQALAGPLRLCYSGPVLRRPSPDRPEGIEAWQAGCERVSPAQGPEGDVEMVRLAARTTAELRLRDAVLELGHWGLVGPLLERIPWPAEGRQALEGALNRKSLSRLEELGRRHGETSEWVLLRSLLHLGGRPAEVERLRAPMEEAGIWSAWEELRTCGGEAARAVPGLKIRLEPTDVRHWSYYTGFTVKVFAPDHAYALLSGGRYDGLYPALGRPYGAFGFAVYLSRLLEGGRREPCRASR
jgi:ATP phosphoribosyltransferase regulatory subunit